MPPKKIKITKAQSKAVKKHFADLKTPKKRIDKDLIDLAVEGLNPSLPILPKMPKKRLTIKEKNDIIKTINNIKPIDITKLRSINPKKRKPRVVKSTRSKTLKQLENQEKNIDKKLETCKKRKEDVIKKCTIERKKLYRTKRVIKNRIDKAKK
jgi:hypothetical protein